MARVPAGRSDTCGRASIVRFATELPGTQNSLHCFTYGHQVPSGRRNAANRRWYQTFRAHPFLQSRDAATAWNDTELAIVVMPFRDRAQRNFAIDIALMPFLSFSSVPLACLPLVCGSRLQSAVEVCIRAHSINIRIRAGTRRTPW